MFGVTDLLLSCVIHPLFLSDELVLDLSITLAEEFAKVVGQHTDRIDLTSPD
jgi:hypothetical protein